MLSTVVCSQLTPLSGQLHDMQNIIIVHGITGAVGDADNRVFARGLVAVLDGVSGESLPEGVRTGTGGSYCECCCAH